MSASPENLNPAAPCVHCGVPVTHYVGGEPICDTCYPLRGSCCQEWDEDAGDDVTAD